MTRAQKIKDPPGWWQPLKKITALPPTPGKGKGLKNDKSKLFDLSSILDF